MRLTVLGAAASCAGPGQACAGHLVEGGNARVLFDCGNGVLANLARVVDPIALDAVFITHYHPDHFVDLFAFHALLRYAPDGPAGPIELYLPGGLWERMTCLLSPRGIAELESAFHPHVLSDGEPVSIGDGLTVTPRRVVHTEPTFALVAEADGATLVYTSDTAPGPEALAAVRGADLILAEATLPERFAGAAPHLTSGEAGALAAEAGAGALVLSHVWPTNDRQEMAEIGSKAFGAPVTVAKEFDIFDVLPRQGE